MRACIPVNGAGPTTEETTKTTTTQLLKSDRLHCGDAARKYQPEASESKINALPLDAVSMTSRGIGIPIKLLHEAEGHTVTVETLTGESMNFFFSISFYRDSISLKAMWQ